MSNSFLLISSFCCKFILLITPVVSNDIFKIKYHFELQGFYIVNVFNQ